MHANTEAKKSISNLNSGPNSRSSPTLASHNHQHDAKIWTMDSHKMMVP